jgi:pSer/pThr/pTyr-binding forkhead associated (FHA) protein
MAHLLITTGPGAGKYFPLANRPLSVGRDPARDVQILDPKVSRKHFVVRRVGDDYTIIPLKSVNAVVLNGQELTGEVVLHDRDQIEVGDTLLRFRSHYDSDAANALDLHKATAREAWEERTILDRS